MCIRDSREIVDLWKNEDSGEIAPAWLEHLNQLIDRLDSEQMCIRDSVDIVYHT